MKRFGAMAAVALVALLLALPLGLVAAQDGSQPSANVPPAVIHGNAMADGLPVPEGTMVVATAGDQKIGSTMTMEGGEFSLQIPGGEDMVTFMVGDRDAEIEDQITGESLGTEVMLGSGNRKLYILNADLAGEDGAVGEMGPQGPRGPAGPAGSPGVPGPGGADGAMGPAGADGAAGSAGPAGPPGPQGPEGAQGAVGPPGPQGPQGEIGPSGATGSMGIIALIVAIVAAVIAVAAIVMGRRAS